MTAQLIFILGKKIFLKRNLLSLGALLISTVFVIAIGFHTFQFSYYPILLFVSFWYINFSYLRFRENIIMDIDELGLTLWTVLFVFLFITSFNAYLHIKLIIFALGCSVLWILLGTHQIHKWGRLLLYVWFLICICSISFLLFPWKYLDYISYGQIALWEYFFFGTILFNSLTYIFLLLRFIPLPGKKQSFSERLNQIKEHAQFLSTKYVEKQYAPRIILGSIIVILFSLALNMYFHVFNTVVIVSFWLITYQLFITYQKMKKT